MEETPSLRGLWGLCPLSPPPGGDPQADAASTLGSGIGLARKNTGHALNFR